MSGRNLFLTKILWAIILTSIAANLAGAFAPELGFDALWYHLTIPKLYFEAGRIFFVPGGLLYYSAMPRLAETAYLAMFRLFGPETTAPHLLNWAAGVGAAAVTYKLARKLGLSSFFSLLSSLIFYVTPLVGWQSGSAYVDLIRTFFEILALYLVVDKKLLFAALAAGLAVSVKTLALGSFLPLAAATYLVFGNLLSSLFFLLFYFTVAVPWFFSAWLSTGYPFYPLGSGILDATHRLGLSAEYFPRQDLTSPFYILIFPFLGPVIRFRRFAPLLAYCLIGFIVWYLTPHTGGGRFLLPYLPAMAVLAASVVSLWKNRFFTGALFGSFIVIAVFSLFYRVAAAKKLLPLFLGRETKTQYLCANLDFKTAVFADCDGWFAKNIKPTDLVLVDNSIHNLFYIDFPFVHQSWYQGQKVDYLLSRDARNLPLIYDNHQTGLKLYAL